MNDTKKIPLVDLAWQHSEIEQEVWAGWREVTENTSFVLGPHVARFEEEFAVFSGVNHCLGVGSGTDALELALRAMGIAPGDEVILPANTFIATALAVTRAGATPVLVDCEPGNYLISPESIEPAVTKRTRAIIPVHLYGQMAPVREIREAFPGLVVVEDGAQSQGAVRHGSPSGSVGHVAATSFYPGKNIGAYGDAGAVLTGDDGIADSVFKLRNWGSGIKYHHPEKGFNSRLDTIQAVVLLAKLARLAEWNKLRAEAAERYGEMLRTSPIELPEVLDGNSHVWHLYVIQTADRDVVLVRLNENGIGAGIHYPVPIHLQGAYSDLGYGIGSFPVAEALANRALSLPMYPGITEDDQDRVVSRLIESL
ncbi:MAG: DegT/DnrJ/EryC1/StrS family aminotransferase [Acidimicrobiia bacterium]|nr:DegT/DnrJ/EryC1/StrS family aminotransferase [Acidimicrobiia bacterium]